MNRILALVVAVLMLLSCAACAAPADPDNLVGISMPAGEMQQWKQDGAIMKQQLEKAGCSVDLRYAGNDAAQQAVQLENMIANGCKVLVIAPVDVNSLGDVLAKARQAGVTVIAYDRLIMNSDAVSYYVTFDNWLVGVRQGEYIRDKLDLDNAAGPFNIEFITGDPGDNTINYYYYGAMSILQPYLDNGKLVCPSGQTEKVVVATANWASDAAQARFETILGSYYSDGKTLHAVLASNDSTALGVANALESSYSGEYPILTGQGCDIASVRNIIAGRQSMSIFKDTRTLAAKTVEMVDALMKGTEPTVNDTQTYDNGTGIIPSFLCEPVFADLSNYEQILVESGYCKADDLK